MLLAAAVLFFAHPTPLDMPRAEAYLAKGSDGVRRLVDRYAAVDLWTSRTVLGRWEDDDGRMLTVSRLDTVPPGGEAATVTRREYAAQAVVFSKKEEEPRGLAIARLSPFELPEKPVPPRQAIRGFEEVGYLQGTNTTSVVCSFLPERSDAWYLAVWDLVEGDEIATAVETFEGEFLGKWDAIVKERLRSELDRPKARSGKAAKDARSERELLRADARHSVTNYTSWHVTDGDEFTVLDDLPPVLGFVPSLTNDLKRMRARYAETVPGPLDGSNVLAVARIFRDRDEYLDAVGEDMKWSAACWSPERRELVAYLPLGGAAELLKTIRHEAFHQYLSYAASMIPAAPWFNEGYAQYFEDEESDDWGLKGTRPDLEALAEALPGVMAMDYERFYEGTDLERLVRYRLAWSVAYFLEKGADGVRFRPFKDVKRDYLAALVSTHDMAKATAAAFGSADNLRLFVAEWLKFWTDR